ncbi:MAG: hypothetical protein INF90_14750 [Roseomonas sp.]|jgi:hypothetical protein|nr:hypothetical protein [Roseomonas sp.]
MSGSIFNRFNSFVADLANGVHNLGSNQLRVMLTNTAPVATNGLRADITEIAAAGGYAAGGFAVTVTSSAQAAGVYRLIADDILVTPSAPGFGPFRYAVLYNDTAVNDPLIGWWDRGSSVSAAPPDNFVLDLSPTNGVFSIT